MPDLARRQRTAARTLVLLVALCCLAAGGCEGHLLRRCEYDGITALTNYSTWPWQRRPYRQVELEPAKMKQVDGNAFTVLLPDGRVRRSSEITESLVIRLGAVQPPNYAPGRRIYLLGGGVKPRPYVSDWYRLGARFCWSFTFPPGGGPLTRLVVTGDEPFEKRSLPDHPHIGDPTGATLFPVPLDEAQLVTLFGPPRYAGLRNRWSPGPQPFHAPAYWVDAQPGALKRHLQRKRAGLPTE